MRLFVAISLPEQVRAQLLDLRADRLHGARAVRREALHLTLAFIGSVPEDKVAAIQEALSKVVFEPFEIAVRGAGVFPERGAARVLWAGIRASEPLERLHAAVHSALAGTGCELETRDFRPHITLARFRQPPRRDQLATFLLNHEDLRISRVPVQAFHLYNSELGPDGSRYQVLHTASALPRWPPTGRW